MVCTFSGPCLSHGTIHLVVQSKKPWTDPSLLYFIYYIQSSASSISFILVYLESSIFILLPLLLNLLRGSLGFLCSWPLPVFSQFHSQRDSFKYKVKRFHSLLTTLSRLPNTCRIRYTIFTKVFKSPHRLPSTSISMTIS